MTIGPSILHNSWLEEFLQEVEMIENVIERRNARTSLAYTPDFKKKKISGVQKTHVKIRYEQISGIGTHIVAVMNRNLDYGIISFPSVHRRHC